MTVQTLREFFFSLPNRLDRDAAEDVEAVFQFDLSGSQGGQYILAVRNGECQVAEGRHDDPSVTLSMAGEDCLKVLGGQLGGTAAVMAGKLRVTGDIGLAMQLKTLFPGIG